MGLGAKPADGLGPERGPTRRLSAGSVDQLDAAGAIARDEGAPYVRRHPGEADRGASAAYGVPCSRPGRLGAVDRSVRGRGSGGELLLAAGMRAPAVAAEVGGALAIDAKEAARWYERFGVLPLSDDLRRLILPLDVIAVAIASVGRQRC